jgi:hypothetical protein
MSNSSVYLIFYNMKLFTFIFSCSISDCVMSLLKAILESVYTDMVIVHTFVSAFLASCYL